ncbi:TPA: hypothetical protein MIV08_22125 [Klebsiella pneumoniae]|nr:hypothetical protein DMR30_25975 [Klebsiella variicola]TYX29892.1 hypothetical protein FCG76_027985 [Klebsiella pneumoniae]TYX47638.1 hypothetical protein FCG83_028115 [Klebsiella pneumoniae]SAX35213.1 Uncharacterised protein [Klebsiella pneumoniae]HBX8069500.1 hypothetical protein [Klebsiella pneumoniae]
MKTVCMFNKLKGWCRITGVILIPVLLIINMATLLTSHDGFVVVRSLLFIFVLTIIARRLLP